MTDSYLHSDPHGPFAKTERKVFTWNAPPIYRVECLCGWESDWNYDWAKSLDGHIRREQNKREKPRSGVRDA